MTFFAPDVIRQNVFLDFGAIFYQTLQMETGWATGEHVVESVHASTQSVQRETSWLQRSRQTLRRLPCSLYPWQQWQGEFYNSFEIFSTPFVVFFYSLIVCRRYHVIVRKLQYAKADNIWILLKRLSWLLRWCVELKLYSSLRCEFVAAPQTRLTMSLNKRDLSGNISAGEEDFWLYDPSFVENLWKIR